MPRPKQQTIEEKMRKIYHDECVRYYGPAACTRGPDCALCITKPSLAEADAQPLNPCVCIVCEKVFAGNRQQRHKAARNERVYCSKECVHKHAAKNARLAAKARTANGFKRNLAEDIARR